MTQTFHKEASIRVFDMVPYNLLEIAVLLEDGKNSPQEWPKQDIERILALERYYFRR